MVFPDQFIDFTRHRSSTFYEEFRPGELKHTPMADPFNKEMREKLISKANSLGYTLHRTATVITIEGPRFSTRELAFEPFPPVIEKFKQNMALNPHVTNVELFEVGLGDANAELPFVARVDTNHAEGSFRADQNDPGRKVFDSE